MKRFCRCIALALLIPTSMGCSDNSSQPIEETTPPFYPLELGNSWVYDFGFIVRFHNADSGAFISADTLSAIGEVTLEGAEMVSGITYVVETTVATTATATDTIWARLRQDSDGLFVANISTRLPPTLSSNQQPELVRLRYPISVGAEWTVYEGPPRVTATVEALDTLTTSGGSFAAYRVRIDRANQGANDWQRVWYGRCGKIRSERHIEFIAVDPGDDTRVRVVTEETEVMTNASVAEPTDCSNESAQI